MYFSKVNPHEYIKLRIEITWIKSMHIIWNIALYALILIRKTYQLCNKTLISAISHLNKDTHEF